MTPCWMVDPSANEIVDAHGVVFRLSEPRIGRDGIELLMLGSAAPDLVAALVALRSAAAYALSERNEDALAVLRITARETDAALAKALGSVPEAVARGRGKDWPWA